jgi:hypothetical protein
VVSMATTDVGRVVTDDELSPSDIDDQFQWNIANLFTWTTSVDYPILLPAQFQLGVSLLTAATLTVDCLIWWTETRL